MTRQGGRDVTDLSAAEAAQAIAELEASIRAAELRLARSEAFIDFQPRFVPGCERRPDLVPIFDVFERAYAAARGEGRPVIALVSSGPQVGKTLAGQAACAAWLARCPADELAFIAYNDDLAREKSRKIRDIAKAAGVAVRGDSSAVDRWQTTSGGGFLARGRNGGVTGRSGLSLIWVDDPYKDGLEAQSEAISRSIAETVSGVIFTRRHARTSVVISHTRWTTNDLIAQLDAKLRGRIEAHGVDLVNVSLPCVDADTGEPLITFGGRDRAFYEAQRLLVTDHDWWALYMGSPRPREGKLLRGVHTYDVRPGRYACAIGMDLAYSTRTTADWSVAVVLARELDVEPGQLPRFYVLEVLRRRCSFTEWLAEMRALQMRYLGAQVHMRTGGQEAALLETAQSMGLSVRHEPTKGDKLVNARALEADWNHGRMLVPASATWDVSGYVSRALDFSGMSSAEVDDEIDATVTAHKALSDGVLTPGNVGRAAGRVPAARGGWL